LKQNKKRFTQQSRLFLRKILYLPNQYTLISLSGQCFLLKCLYLIPFILVKYNEVRVE